MTQENLLVMDIKLFPCSTQPIIKLQILSGSFHDHTLSALYFEKIKLMIKKNVNNSWDLFVSDDLENDTKNLLVMDMKFFPCSTQLSMKFFLFINVKMPTIVGILTFMSRKNSIISLSEPKRSQIS